MERKTGEVHKAGDMKLLRKIAHCALNQGHY